MARKRQDSTSGSGGPGTSGVKPKQPQQSYSPRPTPQQIRDGQAVLGPSSRPGGNRKPTPVVRRRRSGKAGLAAEARRRSQ